MKISDVKINGIKNPIGFKYDYILCSWKVEDTNASKQENAKISVSTDPDFKEVLYEKEGKDLNQTGEKLEISLTPRTAYYVRVEVTGDNGDKAVSETAYFETGKMDEFWSAKWIGAEEGDSVHPVLKKTVNIEKTVKQARFYGTGVGMFELYVNGKKVGNEYLAPYLTDYESCIQVITYPLSELVKGDNTVEIMLGRGWYMGLFGLDLKRDNFGSRMAAIAEIHIEYEDGTTDVVVTDESWDYSGSFVEDSGIYDGEIQNKLLYEAEDGTVNNPVKKAVVIEPSDDPSVKNIKTENLMDRISVPVVVKEELPVKEVIYTPAGETVLDFGQNFAGFVEFEADFAKGTKIVFECAEILQEGNFYHGNYRDAESKFTYISDGTKETVRPMFTFYGFRYIRVTGWPEPCLKESFTGKVLYSDIDRTGYIKTSSDKVNRLYENTLWGQKSNFIDIPTDCPQRSERLGWTGDIQVFAPTASYHMDTRAFFHKFFKDLMDEQKYIDGAIPNFIPNFGHAQKAGSVWADVATFVPDTVYHFFGSKEEMAYAYPLMKDYVEFVDKSDAARGERTYMVDFMDTFGDWLALDGMTPTSFKGSTNDNFISSVYYYRSVQIVKEMAIVLDKAEDAARYQKLEDEIIEAIRNEFFTPSGRLSIDTQAAYVIALKFKVYRDRQKVIDQFKERLKRDMYSIKCGFVGAPLLCTVLAEAGMYETAYDFLLNEKFPGWLFEVNMGATTIWERWNSVGEDGVISNTGMNSLNHYAYGSVMEFVYAHVAGIRPLEPGFKKAVIAPKPDIRLNKVECSYDSAAGKYGVCYELLSDGMIDIKVEIPFNCEAVVELPGHPEKEMILGSGTYEFNYMPDTDYRKPYSRNTTLRRLAADGFPLEILGKYAPVIAGIAGSGDPEMGANTLDDISHMGYLPFDPEKLEEAIKELSELTVGA